MRSRLPRRLELFCYPRKPFGVEVPSRPRRAGLVASSARRAVRGGVMVGVMSEAVKLIVDAYVSLKDRQALEEMREHRQRMRKSLQEKADGAFDVSKSVQDFDNDIEIVESGLVRLSAN